MRKVQKKDNMMNDLQTAYPEPAAPVLGVPSYTSRHAGSPRVYLAPPAVTGLSQTARFFDTPRYIDPPMLCCALTGRLMCEPVLADDGYTYERDIIHNWMLADNSHSPLTEQPLLCNTLVDNNNIKMAIVALTRWRQAGAPDDVRTWLLPAIIDPGGSHNPMLQPMTLSEGTTCDASNLAAMFQKNNVRSPLTQKLWIQHFENPRYNRALQALSAAILGYNPPKFPTRRLYATWDEPALNVPRPSSRQAYSSFLCGYTGTTKKCICLPFCAAFAVGCPSVILLPIHASTGIGVGMGFGACVACSCFLRAIDYPYYLKANEKAAALYEHKLKEAYTAYNAQRQIIGLPPVTQDMQR